MKTEHKKEIIDETNNESVPVEKNTNMLVAAFMIFIFPIIAILLGAFIGGYIGKFIEVSIMSAQIMGGIVGFALSAVIIKLFDQSLKADKSAKKIHWDDL